MKNKNITDYNWNSSHNLSPDYVVKEVVSSFDKYLPEKSLSIIDCGCGGGFLLNWLYKNGYENIWGFDVSKSGIDISKDKYPKLEDRFVEHDASCSKLPQSLPQKPYDVALSIEVIEHLFNPRTYLKNINSWLKPGGYLIISTPYHGYIKNLLISILGLHDKHFNPSWEGGHIKFFSKSTLASLLIEESFEIIDFIGCGRLPYLWKSMLIVTRKI